MHRYSCYWQWGKRLQASTGTSHRCTSHSVGIPSNPNTEKHTPAWQKEPKLQTDCSRPICLISMSQTCPRDRPGNKTKSLSSLWRTLQWLVGNEQPWGLRMLPSLPKVSGFCLISFFIYRRTKQMPGARGKSVIPLGTSKLLRKPGHSDSSEKTICHTIMTIEQSGLFHTL